MTQWSADTVFVVFGDDWGRRVSSMQHVFRHIVPNHRVVWVNGIGHRLPTLHLSDVRRAMHKGLAMVRRARRVEGGSDDGPQPAEIVEPRVLPWHHLSPVRAMNTRTLTRAIRAALGRVAPGAAPVLVTGSPPSVGVIGQLGELASIYFCMDDFVHLEGVTGWMLEPLERRLLERVDAVVATAEELVRVKRPVSGRSFYLPQGVNYDHFATPRAIPADLAALPGPRIGFAGGISSCVELDLLGQLATAFPDGSVVLVGPATVDLSPLGAYPNIHVLGRREYSDLPAYVQHFDVGTIPYILNDWTRSVDPLKLLEYLAAGLPVVSTDLPEVRKYADVVDVQPTAAGFVHAVRQALASGAEAVARRQALAARHTWGARAEEFMSMVQGVLARPTASAVGGAGVRSA